MNRIPLVVALALAVASALVGPSTATLLERAAALFAALGFWALFFALSRALYRWSRLTLGISAALLLALAALALAQEAHRLLYGFRFDVDRLQLVRENWGLVTSEVVAFLASLPRAALAGGIAVLIGGFAWTLEKSRAPVYRPLRGAGALHIAATLWWAISWLASPLHAAVAPVSPDLAALSLAGDLWREMNPWRERRGPLSYRVARHGVRPVDSPPAAGPRPHVILVLLESVRADHLSVYGYARETTPNLRAWAALPDAVVFPHAFANATSSYLSMISLTSGLDMRREEQDFARSALLWDQLAARGYQTCFITLSLSYPNLELDRFFATPGLGTYRDLGQEQLAADGPPRELGPRLALALLGPATFRSLTVDRDDRRGLDAFRECLERRDPGRPFFGMWELESTHYRYRHPDAFALFQPASSYAFRSDDARPLVNAYDNALLYVDDLVGRLLRLLEAGGLADETVMVVASDHGESFFDDGTLFHGHGLGPSQSHVPLVVRIPDALRRRYPPSAWAALEANRTRGVQLADLLPTIAALADGSLEAPDPTMTDGANLLRPLAPEREIYLSNHPPFRREPQRPRDHAFVRGDALEVFYANGRPPERFPLDGIR